ncbi:transcription repressor OFP7-like [Iris pallida]|uniref:Transcription repressor OFP7-like n=1 Tax=Iris pallida TaxID=29817 RepID=A0AAX6H160_IRIPA|nr:transcription repressor OFP7-like [Iris pallida]
MARFRCPDLDTRTRARGEGGPRRRKRGRRTVVPVGRSTRGSRRRSARGWPPTVSSGPVAATERRPDLVVPVLAVSRHYDGGGVIPPL